MRCGFALCGGFGGRLGIYAVPDAETLKLNTNLNRVLHIYLVSNSIYYGICIRIIKNRKR